MSSHVDDDVEKTKNTLKPEPDEVPSETRFPADEEAVRVAETTGALQNPLTSRGT